MAVVNVGEKEPNEGQEDILVYKENVRVAAGGKQYCVCVCVC